MFLIVCRQLQGFGCADPCIVDLDLGDWLNVENDGMARLTVKCDLSVRIRCYRFTGDSNLGKLIPGIQQSSDALDRSRIILIISVILRV